MSVCVKLGRLWLKIDFLCHRGDAGVALFGRSEGEARGGGLIGELLGGLLEARLGQAWRLHQLRESVLVLRRMKAAIE